MEKTPELVADGSSALGIEEILAEEVLIIRHSGEIPEIAYHSSLHYLSEDPDGPGLDIGRLDLGPLREAVVERYKFIILRDITTRNRDKSIYRGLKRCLANWRRLERFAGTHGVDITDFAREASGRLLSFLEAEVDDVESARRTCCVNCTWDEVLELARCLGVDERLLPKGLRRLCPEGDDAWAPAR